MNILIVDDNAVNLAVIGGMVAKIEGCTQKSILNPIEALEYSYEALKKGANDFLNKPIDGAEFTARVKKYAANSKKRKRAVKSCPVAVIRGRKSDGYHLGEREAIMRLSKAAKYRDPETGMHIFRMSAYSEHIAKNLGLSREDCKLILEAAPMHDIGKVGIPDHILLKPGKLDEDEFAVMKTHSQIGYDILKESYSVLLQTAAKIALFHHEKWDGSGYPAGLKGEDIDIFARVVAVADVFDALTSEKPYKKAWELEKAVSFIKENSGSHFDPECVEAMFKNWSSVLYIMAKYKES